MDKSFLECEIFENLVENVYSDLVKRKSSVLMGYESDVIILYMEESDVILSYDDVDDVILLDNFSFIDIVDEFFVCEEIKIE